MGRSKKLTVDYFPHLISRGAKISYIENTYGNDGYATWFKILEELAVSENHFINLKDEIKLMFLSDKCKVKEDLLLNIINDLSRMGVINKELWESKIIWSQTFYDSVSYVWERRNEKPFTLEILLNQYSAPKIKNKPLAEEKTTKKSNLASKLFINVRKDDVEGEQMKHYFDIALAFYERIYKNLENLGSTTKTLEASKFKKWIDPIRLLITVDEVSKQQLTDVWEFLKDHDFWGQNIQSTKKLREKFSILHAQSKSNGKNRESKSSKEGGNRISEEYKLSIAKRLSS